MCKNTEEYIGKKFNNEGIDIITKQCCFGPGIDKQITGTNQSVYKKSNKYRNVIH